MLVYNISKDVIQEKETYMIVLDVPGRIAAS